MAGAALERSAGQATNFSIGRTGEGPRTFNRHSVLWGTVVSDAGFYTDIAHRAVDMGGERGQFGRTTVRALTTERVADHLLNGGGKNLPITIESAIPIDTSAGRIWLVGAAKNGELRKGVNTRQETRKRVDATSSIEPQSAGTLVEKATRKYDLVTDIPNGSEKSLHELWGNTFGWSEAGIEELQERLKTEKADASPTERTVFFGGLLKEGQFAAAAMIESVPLIGPEGETIKIAEATEWNAIPEERGNGAVPAAVAASLSQLIDAYHGQETYTVFAECNTAEPLVEPPTYPPAPVVARKTGFVVPNVYFDDGSQVTQVLEQNVGINDSNFWPRHSIAMPMEDGGVPMNMRDFVVFQLPRQSIDNLYSPAERARVRSMISAA